MCFVFLFKLPFAVRKVRRLHCDLDLWVSVGFWDQSLGITWKLVRNAHSQAAPQTHWVRNVRVGLVVCDLFIIYFILFYFIFRAAPAADGGSQARGQIRAMATSLYHSHSNAGSTACRNPGVLTHWARSGIEPTFSQTLCQVLNPLNHNGNSCGLFNKPPIPMILMLTQIWEPLV